MNAGGNGTFVQQVYEQQIPCTQQPPQMMQAQVQHVPMASASQVADVTEKEQGKSLY